MREIEIPFVETSKEMIDRWKSGEFDVLTVWNLSIDEAPDTLYDLIPDLHTRYIGLRLQRGQAAFSNQQVRKAFSHAINQEALLRDIDSERASTRGGAIPPAMPGPRTASRRIRPRGARKLLAEQATRRARGLPS